MNRKGSEFALERIGEVDALCFAHCVASVPSSGTPRPKQQLCLHNCYRKTLSALDFIGEYDRVRAVRPR